MKTTWWKQSSWDAICDSCGLKFKADQLRLRWDGLMVCDADWETRHPQDLIRPIPDQPAPPWTRPDVDPTYWAQICTPEGRQAIPGYAIPGCAIPSLVNGYGPSPEFI